jgi:hypothetical protein
MIEKIRTLFFEPRYPQRYIGRHRARMLPFITVSVRR